MTLVPIQFTYNGTSYKAKTYKVDGTTVQYLLSSIDPVIELKTTIFEVNADRSGLKIGSEPNYPEIGASIVSAIKSSCYNLGIPFLS